MLVADRLFSESPSLAHPSIDCFHSQQVQTQVALLTLPPPDSIILARPLNELGSYLYHMKLPPLQLLARVIHVLAYGVFRGHLCDRVLLTGSKEIRHSLEGKVVQENAKTLQEKYPYMLENAFILFFKREFLPAIETPPSDQPHQDHYVGGNIFERQADFSHYTAINPQMIREHYKAYYQASITPKTQGNTIADLLQSRYFMKRYFHQSENAPTYNVT